MHYIDTDLPEVVATKAGMIRQLQMDKDLRGNFELLPLDATDGAAVNSIVQRFAAGSVSIVNEGLLMYLGLEEKIRLCQTLHPILKARNGCWITADIYIKWSSAPGVELPQSDSERAFFAQHNVEDNKFDSFDAAKAFFAKQGFEVVAESVPDYGRLSILPQLQQLLPEEARNGEPPKIQATWTLQPI